MADETSGIGRNIGRSVGMAVGLKLGPKGVYIGGRVGAEVGERLESEVRGLDYAEANKTMRKMLKDRKGEIEDMIRREL